MKGFFKGFKNIAQIFVVKEHEMQIGHPTDVKHLAHIGSESSSTNAPSWMQQFQPSSDFSPTSFGIGQSRETSWFSQEYEPRGTQSSSEANTEGDQTNISKAQKKLKQKKTKALSPSSRSMRKSSKSRSTCASAAGEENQAQEQLQGSKNIMTVC